MKTLETGISGLVLIEPRVHGDERGLFLECWKSSSYEAAGLPGEFVQSNLSRSAAGVLRGLHYQYPEPQGKLVSVLEGSVFDVAVDLRRGSPTFGNWAGVELSAENHRQLYVPEGFAHGFCVLDGPALLSYMCTREFSAEFDRVIAWNDPDVGIRWPIEPTLLSGKDAAAPLLRDLPEDLLPRAGP